MDRDAILLTPGPLTTTLRTKLAMLRDWGSWDTDFIALTTALRHQLLAILHGEDSHVVVPRHGRGRVAVEGPGASRVPRAGPRLRPQVRAAPAGRSSSRSPRAWMSWCAPWEPACRRDR